MTKDYSKFGRVAVLMGGCSSEREISLKSGEAIFKALEASGFDVCSIVIDDQDDSGILELVKEANIECAFIALHGALGEDGRIQSLLEQANVKYTGSGVKSSRLCIDKVLTQSFLKKNGVSIPAFMAVSRNDQDHAKEIVSNIKEFPVVVKPSREGSSIGVSIVKNKDDLFDALQLAWEFGEKALVEEYIQGQELTVGIFAQKPLPVVEVCSQREFYDYAAKYYSNSTQYRVPAQIPEFLSGTLKSVALKVHKILGCQDFSRVDFMVDSQLNYYVLEINTVPGFTSKSLLPKAAHEIGISFNQLCSQIMESAYGKKKEKQSIAVGS